MCDDATEAENETYAQRLRLSRRELGIGAGTAVAALLTGCGTAAPPAQRPDPEHAPAPPPAPARQPAPAPASRRVTIDTPDGTAEAFFVSPQSGQHPGVLMWPDVAGLRDAYMKMATRLAEAGYAVLAVNQYYRSTELPVFTSFAEFQSDEGRAKIGPMREELTPERVASDGAAFVAWLDGRKEVDRAKRIATTGYCMGGPFAFRTAAAAAERVGVVASFHGGGLVTDAATSPHLLMAAMKAAALVCIAQNDDERQPEAKNTLRQAAQAANVAAEVEVYPAQHGFCTIDSPVYDEAQAERAWSRMLATFAAHL
jgi:carboxymethylenebutenolidase